ncbi:MAG: hypothetical protein QOF48_1981 [Verrucomicrobiota bacterium]|jgi:hypothetical protein
MIRKEVTQKGVERGSVKIFTFCLLCAVGSTPFPSTGALATPPEALLRHGVLASCGAVFSN